MKLIRKKEVRRPTIWGLLLMFLLLAAIGSVLISGLYPFLAQNRPLPEAEVVIIEGWLEDAEFAQVLAAVKPGALFVATGGPIKFGAGLLEEKTYAEATAARLRKMGVPAEAIITASAPDVAIDRTYAAALAARHALEERNLLGRPANLYTLGAHSRRSFLLYRLAFDSEGSLGVVALENEELDLRHWCSSSRAFRQVVGETIAWLYVQCTRWRYK